MKSTYRTIMGRNCIRELLRARPKQIVEVYTCLKERDDPLIAELKKQHIPVITKSKHELTARVDSDSHQSFVAAVKEPPTLSLTAHMEKLSQKAHSLVLMLDSIYDPHNLGALLRTALCFGVDLVIYSKNRGTDITPVASKTSSGASELIPIAKVSNLAESIKPCKEAGFTIIAADVGKEAHSLYHFTFPEKTLLILGSEGIGIQPLLKKKCDAHLLIPMRGAIDSLNVSQAASVLFAFYNKQFLTS